MLSGEPSPTGIREWAAKYGAFSTAAGGLLIEWLMVVEGGRQFEAIEERRQLAA